MERALELLHYIFSSLFDGKVMASPFTISPGWPRRLRTYLIFVAGAGGTLWGLKAAYQHREELSVCFDLLSSF